MTYVRVHVRFRIKRAKRGIGIYCRRRAVCRVRRVRVRGGGGIGLLAQLINDETTSTESAVLIRMRNRSKTSLIKRHAATMIRTRARTSIATN